MLHMRLFFKVMQTASDPSWEPRPILGLLRTAKWSLESECQLLLRRRPPNHDALKAAKLFGLNSSAWLDELLCVLDVFGP